MRAAAARIHGTAFRTPLVQLDPAGSGRPIHLKLENLQPIGSFKLRAAANALALAHPETLARGVFTASAGNMAQGVAWVARERGIAATAIVPDTAPATKLAAIERLGAGIVKVPFERWWQVLVERTFPGQEGLFVHPCADRAVMAGNGTIALEILKDLPEVRTVLVPWGGGGLACGIAATFAALSPEVRVVACEVESGAPLAASLAAGRPTAVDYQPSFVDGAGSRAVLPEMWSLAQRFISGSRVVSVDAAAAAVRLLAERNHIVAEGAGALPVAAALAAELEGPVVAVVSGGNIDLGRLVGILTAETPSELLGSVKYASEEDLLSPVDETWDADR